VYGPSSVTASRVVSKIQADFNGALPYWEKYFDEWIFVHNDREGLSPIVAEALLRLGSDHEQIRVNHWGFVELRNQLFELEEVDIRKILGEAPTMVSTLDIGFPELARVLDEIAVQPALPADVIRPVSPNKLSENQLSDNVRILLRSGMEKADRVASYLNEAGDLALGDDLASSFNSRYKALVEEEKTPDDIFNGLWELTKSSATNHDAAYESARLAVLAYFFERCDIFEDPRDISS
tara:strand:- start:200 stop:910 length:711 start_codon:yes stop_codon:yes gene_type:complete